MLSDQFKVLRHHFKDRDFTVEELIKILGEKSHGFFILIFSLPFLLPIPLPGLSTPFGLAMMLVGVAWFRRKEIWIPEKIRHRKIHAKVFQTVFKKGEYYSLKIESFFKARGRIFFHHTWSRGLIALLVIVSAFMLALPLPPGTNFPPALTLVFLAMAILFEDLMLLFIGVVSFAIKVIILWFALEFVLHTILPKIMSHFS